MSTQTSTASSSANAGSTAGFTPAPAQQPMQWGLPAPQAAGIGSLPQAGYYMNNQQSYYGGAPPQPEFFKKRSWGPMNAPPPTTENYNTAANWQAPAVPAPGSNPALVARQQERDARATAKADAAAAARQPQANPYNTGFVPGSGMSAPPQYPWLTPAEQAQMDAAHNPQNPPAYWGIV